MEIAACDVLKPNGVVTTFGIERTVAFETDSLASTRPVEFEVNFTDAEGMFDVLTQQKVGSASHVDNTSAKSNFAMVCAITFKHMPTEIPEPLTFGMR